MAKPSLRRVGQGARSALLWGLLVLTSGVILGGCDLLGVRPKVIDDLVAVAPAGVHVTVDHVAKDPFGNMQAHWKFQFQTDHADDALASYRAWFVAHGFTVVDVHDPDVQAKASFDVCAVGTGVSIDLDGQTVEGVVGDDAIGPHGELMAGKTPRCP